MLIETNLICENCEVYLTKKFPEFRSKKNGSMKDYWFPRENWKCINCKSCGRFVESHEKTWSELKKEAVARNIGTYPETYKP